MTDYYIMDGRFLSDPDRATVLTHCDNLAEAREYRGLFAEDSVIAKSQDEGVLEFVEMLSGKTESEATQ